MVTDFNINFPNQTNFITLEGIFFVNIEIFFVMWIIILCFTSSRNQSLSREADNVCQASKTTVSEHNKRNINEIRETYRICLFLTSNTLQVFLLYLNAHL